MKPSSTTSASIYDVIVVGGGGSGLAAAVSAAEGGLTVLVLEKQSFLGGTTGIAVGSLTASGTSLQRRSNIEDTVEDHAADVAKFATAENEAHNNEPLRRFFLERAAETYEWLQSMGLSFHGPSPEPPNRVPRMHNVVPNAKAYVAVLQQKLARLGGEILCEAQVTQLTRQAPSGRIDGVEAIVRGTKRRFSAHRGVVLAAGDYASAPDLIARHKGEQFAHIEGINPFAQGDGQRLVEDAGGRLVNMGMTWGPEIRLIRPDKPPFGQLIPATGLFAKIAGRMLPMVPRAVINAYIKRLLVTWQHPVNTLYADGAILINSGGERFCNELESPQREISLAHQPGKSAYLLLDQKLVDRYSEWPHYISTAPEIAYAYVADYLRLRPDVTARGDSLEAVAQLRELPPANLVRTVAEFNRYADGTTGDAWGRTGDRRPLEGSNWIIFGPAKAYFTITEGGAAINRELQVLDHDGEPIEGLYAVGCNGLGGQVLFGHGLHIAWAMTSGRLVGRILAGPR